MPSDSEPRTKAGLALLVDLDAVGALDGATGDNRPYVTTSILAIETEAARLALEGLREAVLALPRILMAYPEDDPVHRAAVLSLISEHYALLSSKEEGS